MSGPRVQKELRCYDASSIGVNLTDEGEIAVLSILVAGPEQLSLRLHRSTLEHLQHSIAYALEQTPKRARHLSAEDER